MIAQDPEKKRFTNTKVASLLNRGPGAGPAAAGLGRFTLLKEGTDRSRDRAQHD